MVLKPGLYQIRYVPPHVTPPFLGGVHAVGEEINQPVEALPLVPPFRGVHTWDVAHPPNNQNQWIITKPGFRPSSIFRGIGPVRAGWGRPLRKAVEREGLEPEAAAEAESKADQEAEEEGLLPHPDLAVLFTVSIRNWNIQEVHNGGGDPAKATYAITVPTKIVGVIAAVGIDGHNLTVKNYPVISTLHYRLPTWQFIPVKNE